MGPCAEAEPRVAAPALVELVGSEPELDRALRGGPCVVLATGLVEYQHAQKAYADAAAACSTHPTDHWRWLVLGPRIGKRALVAAGVSAGVSVPFLAVVTQGAWHVVDAGAPSPWRALEYIDLLRSERGASPPVAGAPAEGAVAPPEATPVIPDDTGVLTSKPLLPTDRPQQAIALACVQAKLGPLPARPVCVFYYADWCGHCTRFKAEWNESAQHASARGVHWIAVNESHPHAKEALLEAGVVSFPTVLRFQGTPQGGSWENMADRFPERNAQNLLTFARGW